MKAVITMDKFGRMVLPGPMRKALQISRPAAFKGGGRLEALPALARKNRIALAPASAQHPPMLARLLSAAVS